MKTNKTSRLLSFLILLTLTFGCTKNKTIDEYSEDLDVNFPENMT